jgi:hypothetical protein
MALTSRLELTVSSTLTSALDFQSITAPLVIRRALDLANGVGARQANVIWADQRSLGPSATESHDLLGGGLVDAVGVAFAPARLRALVIYSALANLNNLTLFGDVNHVPLLGTVATTITLQPGGIYVFTAPATAGVLVTAGTGDIVKVTNAAGTNTVVYDIIMIGANA